MSNEMNGKIETFVPRVAPVRMIQWTGKNAKEIYKLVGHKIALRAYPVGEFFIERGHNWHYGSRRPEEVQEYFKRVEERWGLYDIEQSLWYIPGGCGWVDCEQYPYDSLGIDEIAEILGVVGNTRYTYRSKLIEVEDA